MVLLNCQGPSIDDVISPKNESKLSSETLWADSHFTFTIDPEGLTDWGQDLIRDTITEVEFLTEGAVQFTEMDYDQYLSKDYIEVIEIASIGGAGGFASGVGSHVRPYIYLGSIDKHTILHELLHILGLRHSFQYTSSGVKINTQNIKEDALHNFQIDHTPADSVFNTICDPDSVMNYNPMAFSKTGKPTLEYSFEYKRATKLSKGDIEKIKSAYSK